MKNLKKKDESFSPNTLFKKRVAVFFAAISKKISMKFSKKKLFTKKSFIFKFSQSIVFQSKFLAKK